ncbi:DEHA2E13332p [Debaryomyces hansenii CBS767]|uniref:DEHA2E13332p n=1 Tax=Debaryomyces hansenii (strain ATCC 36239 / CBS 767 / BCRC 21394 / JCM 1990 / NBRC 0083 / IGC 2968) TaxID=284592 RepID=Q6BPI6_DEBHA|nr:DEHA2E13332p [Debaryomyces hansenii CBS767]CAG88125.2 DEHA2E13332p [Debaryomyces hansenii CBS767]|eukprot:XP_459884.2 DEHA2E13332p [Debaryomyces hansenii CBS767]
MIRPLGYDPHANSSGFICGICHNAKSQYTCPNCSALYCSSECYNSEKHSSCSEKFYQTNIEEHLQRGERHEPTHNELKDRKKLVALLHQYNNDAPKSQSSYEDKTNTGQEWKYMAPKGVEDSLQSLQSEFNIEDLHKLNHANKSADGDYEDEDRPLTQEESREFKTIVNESSTEQLLSMLTPEQRKEFENLIKDSNYIVDEEDDNS